MRQKDAPLQQYEQWRPQMKRWFLHAVMLLLVVALIIAAGFLDYANTHGMISREWSARLCLGQAQCLKQLE